MDIDLIAKLKDYNTFVSCIKEEDVHKQYEGKSLLFYAISNNNPESRYLIAMYLLDRGVDAHGINNEEENLLHILLSRGKHNLSETADLCMRLVDAGVDINQIDNKGRVPLQYLVNMKYTDEELEPLCKIFFSREKLLVNNKNAWGKSPLDLAAVLPYRKRMVERMKKFE